MVPLLGRVADGLRTASICDISCSRCDLKSKPKGTTYLWCHCWAASPTGLRFAMFAL